MAYYLRQSKNKLSFALADFGTKLFHDLPSSNHQTMPWSKLSEWVMINYSIRVGVWKLLQDPTCRWLNIFLSWSPWIGRRTESNNTRHVNWILWVFSLSQWFKFTFIKLTIKTCLTSRVGKLITLTCIISIYWPWIEISCSSLIIYKKTSS